MTYLALIFLKKIKNTQNTELKPTFSCTELNIFFFNSIRLQGAVARRTLHFFLNIFFSSSSCYHFLDCNKEDASFPFVFGYHRDTSILNYIYKIYYLALF